MVGAGVSFGLVRRYFLGICFAGGMLPLTIFAQQTAADAYNQGSAKFAKGDRDGALADFSQAIEVDPTYVPAYTMRGMVESMKGDDAAALADFDKAVELDPKGLSYCNRGAVEMRKGDLDAALADFDKAIELDPKLEAAYSNRATARKKKNDLDGAIADCNQVLELNPKSAQAYSERGMVYQAEGSLDEAIADFNQALVIDRNSAFVYNGRGMARGEKGDFDGALSDFDQAIYLASKYADPYDNRGHLRMATGDLEGALADLRQYADLDAKDGGHAHLYIYLVENVLNQKAAADKELTAYLAEHPMDWVSKVGEMLVGPVDFNEADFLAAASSPDAKLDQGQHGEGWYFAGMKRLLAGNKAAAAADFSQCVAMNQKETAAYLLAGVELKVLAGVK